MFDYVISFIYHVRKDNKKESSMGNINLEKKDHVDNDQDTSNEHNEPDYEQD